MIEIPYDYNPKYPGITMLTKVEKLSRSDRGLTECKSRAYQSTYQEYHGSQDG